MTAKIISFIDYRDEQIERRRRLSREEVDMVYLPLAMFVMCTIMIMSAFRR